MLKLAIVFILSLVTLARAQFSQVPPLRLRIARNNLSPNDSVIISWELPPAPVESFSVEWEGVTNGVGAEIAVPLVPGKTGRYSVVLSPLVRGQDYSVEVTALLAPPLRLSELKNFIFATTSLVDVDIFGVTSRTMGLNVTALEPLTADDELRVTVRGEGRILTNINVTTVGNFGRSRLVQLTLPEDIIQFPSKTYQITVESLWLGTPGSAVTEWVTLEAVTAAPVSVEVSGVTPYVMELDVTLTGPIDYNLNFSVIVDVYDMNGQLHSIKNGAIQSLGDQNQTLRIFFNQPLPLNQNYVIRLKTEYNRVESFWYSDLQTIFLHPATTAIGEVVRNTISSFNVTLLFGTQIAPVYRLAWKSKDNVYAGNATFSNSRSLRALQLTVSGVAPGQTYDVTIDALSGPLTIKGLPQMVTLAPASPIFIEFDRNELAVNDSAVLTWRLGEGKTESVTVNLQGLGLTDFQVNQSVLSSQEPSEYTTIVSNLVMGNNYFGNLTAVVGDGLSSEPTQFGFTFAPNAPTSATLIGLTPLQAELNVTQFDDVSPYPLKFTLQDTEGTVYPPQNGTLLSSNGRNRHLRLFFNTPLTPNKNYIIGVQSEYDGEMSLPIYTKFPVMLDPLTPTLIDVQAVGDDKALLFWLPGSSIPFEYILEWASLNSSEYGTLRFVTPALYTGGTLNATVVNLTSSHTYEFNVRPMGSDDRNNILPFIITMPPAYPRDVRIFPTPSSPKDSFTVAWLAGRGSIDYFNVTVAGSDGIFVQRSLPRLAEQSQYNITFSPITPNATYIANVYTVTGDAVSNPVNFEFVNVPSAPMSVSVTGIAQYSMDLSMSLLDSTATVDSIQVDVRDEQGVNYPPQNITITSSDGERNFRLVYDQSRPLPLDREYIITVKTTSGGIVSSPVSNADPISIDPLTPSIVGMFNDGPDTPEKSSTVLSIVPSLEPMDGILIEWFSTDGSESGNITYIPNPQDAVMMIPLTRLTPGQMYILRVTAQGPSGVSRPLETYLALNPLSPYDLSIKKDTASADLLLSWMSVGGKIDYYDITVIGSDGSEQNVVYRPTVGDPVLGPFTLPLTGLTSGVRYEVRIRSSVINGLKSSPAAIRFTQVPSAPTEVRLQQIGQTSAELEVTLLDEAAENPVTDVQLVDDQGQVYQASDNVEWQGSGQTRLLRVNFPGTILPADRNYTARVRTLTNGNWTNSVSTTEETFLDPLTPSVLGIRTSEEGDNITATMGLLQNPGAEKYRVEWFSKDGRDYGTLEHLVNESSPVQSLNVPITGLKSGQSYVFGVQAYGTNRTAVALNYHITLEPAVPKSVSVERNITSPDEEIFLNWSSGGGKADLYNISILGSDGTLINTGYKPTSPEVTGPFKFRLPPLSRGSSYVISVHSISETIRSRRPAFRTFRYVDTDPTEVRLLRMTPYTVELGVTLLGNTSQTPDIEVNLRDGEDRDLFLTSNQTVWRGSGRDRVVQVILSDRPLRASRDYRVAVRTMYNGTWSEPLLSENTVILDPLTPSLAGIQMTPDQDTPRLGTSSSATVLVQPGEALVESYGVEWMAAGTTDTWNTSYTPTQNEAYRQVQIPIEGLVPGQEYTFIASANQVNETASSLQYIYTPDPAIPQSVRVERDMLSPGGLVFLHWKSGGGKTDYYDIRIIGDGRDLSERYTPTPADGGEYKILLPPASQGAVYDISLASVSGEYRSTPVLKQIRYVNSDPTEVTVLGMTPYSAELGISLLGNTTENPEIEVLLLDNNGQDLFVRGSETVWTGSGRDRVVQVNLSDRPLRANRDYRVAVRTLYNGTWSEPLPSQNVFALDPLTPSLTGIQLTPDQDTPRLGTSSSATVFVQPGETLVESYGVEWMATGTTDTWNTSYTPTQNEAYRPVQINITGLVPGQEYTFIASANQANLTATSLQYVYTQVPAIPQSVRVERDLLSPGLVFLHWKSGGGNTDYYEIAISGDGRDITERYIPTPADGEEYKILLPPASQGAVYDISLASVSGEYRSTPVLKQIRYVNSDPTEVTVLGMTPYSAELGISLLGNTTENPEIEVLLLDSNGQDLFVRGNQTVWRGSGRDRVVQVDLSDRPLRANRDYRVAVRTMYNGTWSEPLPSQNAFTLDPLIPFIRSISLTPDINSGETGSSSTAVVSVQPGEDLVMSYLLEWYLQTTGNTDTWNTTYTPTPEEVYQRVNIPVGGLVPGETYMFTATSIGNNRSANGFQYLYTQDASRPSSVKIIENVTSPDGGLLLIWNSGGGKADYYEINVIGGDGTNFNAQYRPTDLGPYMFQLPPMVPGASYGYSVQAVSMGKESLPAIQQFRYVETDPTEVRLLGMTPYRAELGVTLLGNTSQTPDIEVNLRDGEDRDLFLTSNQTVWRGSGRDRIVQVNLSDRPLRASRDYRMAVRTMYNGRWSSPLTSQNYITLDPLMPSIEEIQLVPDENSFRTRTSTIGVVNVRPGEAAVERYSVNWVNKDGTDFNSTSFTPVEVYRPSAITVTGLNPGEEYDFRVTAFQGDKNATGLNYTFTLVPALPQYVKVEPGSDNNNSLMLSWMSGGGKTDMYNIRIEGSDGMLLEQEYVPKADHIVTDPYRIMFPQTTPGENYRVTVTSALYNGMTSYPALMTFTSLPTAPTEVTLKQMTQYGGELEVTLLGNSTVNPDLEVTLRDSDGLTVVTSNQTEWEGSGRQRLVRVKFSETPLPANQSYSVSVRTKNNGTWTRPVTSEDPAMLDPYTPAIMETETGLDNRSSPAGSYTLVWRAGQSPAQQYLIEWRTQDGTESGNTTFTPTTTNQDGSLSYTFDTLTPGQQYEFKISAINQGQMSPGIASLVAQRPEAPRYVKVEPHPGYTNNTLRLSWVAGEGRYQGYRVTLQGSDGKTLQEDYVPPQDHQKSEPYSLMLPPLTPGANYIASVVTVVDENILSNPAEITFTSLPTAPTEVTLKQMTQYGGELEVTLLGNSTVNPDLEVTLRDSDGLTVVTSNQTEWEGTGRQRLVRVKFSETPLPANQSYSVSVRTKNNGTWTESVASEDPAMLDPYTPAIMETETGLDNRSSPAGSYTLVWRPGQSPAQQYLIEWMTQDGTESGNTTFTPTTTNQDGSLSYTFDTLTPGQQYEFKISAINQGQVSPGIASLVAQRPEAPRYVKVEPHPGYSNNSLRLSWVAGEGRYQSYRVTLQGSDGKTMQEDYVPPQDHQKSEPYSLMLPPLTLGAKYIASVVTVVDENILSNPAEITFTSLPTAPTEVTLKQMTQYGGELEVTLLGNSTENPDLEVTLRDSDGLTVVTSNQTEWEGTGRQRLVRVKFSETPLPANQSYSVSVRTKNNGTWTESVASQDPAMLDPYTPAIMETETRWYNRSSPAGSYTLVWRAGQSPAQQYLIEWMTQDGTESGNTTFTPTTTNQDGSLSYTFDTLTPGQQYEFKVTAINQGQLSPGIASSVTLVPFAPKDLVVEPSGNTGDIMLSWYPGGSGRVNKFDVQLLDDQGEIYRTSATPYNPDVTEATKFNIILPTLQDLRQYTAIVKSVVSDTIQSDRSPIFFTYSKSAPSSAEAGKIFQDAFEMNVTLLGDTTESPVVEIQLQDEEGNVYPPINGTVIQKSRLFHLVRFPFNESNLPENRTYTGEVRTLSNGVWSLPIFTMVPLFVDPLAPALLSVRLFESEDGYRTGVLGWEGGAIVPDYLYLSYVTLDGSESDDILLPVTDPEQIGSTTISPLTPGQTYTFIIRAINGNLTSLGTNITVSAIPSSPVSIQIKPSDTSPEDTVELWWEDGLGVVDFHRISVEGTEGIVFHGDVPVPDIPTTLMNVSLWPMVRGNRYHVKLWSVVNKDVLSAPVDVFFTFASTAPTSVNLQKVNTNSAEVNVEMFDLIKSDVTQNLNITLIDEEGRTYSPDRSLEWKREGRHSHIRLWFESELPSNQTYTTSVTSLVNGTWTDPVITTVPKVLDPIQPTIIDVERGGDRSAVVVWRVGATPSNTYIVEGVSRRTGEIQTVESTNPATGQDGATTFVNLNPGHNYIFTVTGISGLQTSKSFPYPYTLDPVSPSNLRLGYSESSSNDSVILMWDLNDGEVDFFRLTWSTLEGNMNYTEDIPANNTIINGLTSFSHKLSPLEAGQTYRILLQTVSSARPGRFVEKMFTFAPNAPSSIVLNGANPFEVGLNVSLFDNAWDNMTIRTVIRDENNNTYPTEDAVIWQIDGRYALTRVPLNRSRLPGGQNYTVTIQTQYNGEWSYPFFVPLYLDSLTPAIRDVQKDLAHPDTMVTVMWLSGSNDTESFNLHLTSRDKTDTRDYTVLMNMNTSDVDMMMDVDKMMNYTVANLTAGQHYTVELTAVRGADQASGLNYSIQMNPSAPQDVVVNRSDSSPNDSAVLQWGKGDGVLDSYNLTWGQYNGADGTVFPSTVVQDVVPSDGLEFSSMLSPLEAGATYQVTTQAISGGVPGEAKQNTFTFAPTAPTNVEVRGITPNSIGLHVTLFESAWENNTLNVEVMDSNNVSYPAHVVIGNQDGRSSVARVFINETRLPAEQSFTVKLQTLYNDEWSFPYLTTPISLDPLTPAIRSVEVNPTSPDTSLTVEWLPGLEHNNEFLLELFSLDGSEEYWSHTEYTDIQDVNVPLNFTFTDLTAGQRYEVQLTTVAFNGTAKALNYTIQLLPSSPMDVLLSPSTLPASEAAILHWKYGAGKVDTFKVTVVEYGLDSNLIQSDMISPKITLPDSVSSYSQIMSPLVPGKTYQVTLDTMSGSKMGEPQTKIFTFGSTAPSSITVDNVTPYGVDLNMTVFGELAEDTPVYIEVTDSDNIAYPPAGYGIHKSMGNTGIVRVNYNNTRLSSDKEYTVSVQTVVNGDWSYPFTSTLVLDPLTPAIINVQPDETSPDTMVLVEFVAGTVDTDVFTLSLTSLDKTEYQSGTVLPGLLDVNTPVQYRFMDLTPGQRYQVQVTAENINGTSSSREWNVITHPMPPSGVRVTPWVASPRDSATLEWNYAGDKDISFIIGLLPFGNNSLPNITEIKMTGTPGEKMKRHTFQLTPLMSGETYEASIQPMVDNTVGDSVQRIFTFSPSAPTEVQVAAISPSSIVLNVSLFEAAWDNLTVRAAVSDSEGNQYATEPPVIRDQSGRAALIQITPQTDRLRSGRNYTIFVQTLHKNTWSFPMSIVTSLNSLTPTIVKVERDMMSPNSIFTVTWLPGQNGTQEFHLEAVAEDGSEYFDYSTTVDVEDFTKEMNYTFVDLTPGQSYIIQLTARDNNKTATALNTTLQMYPSQPINVRIDRSEISPNQSAVLLWEYMDGLHDSFRITWSPLNRMEDFNTTEEILPNFTQERKDMGYSYKVFPLMEAETYHIRLEAIVNGQASDPIDKFFTFAPSSPTHLQVRGITPYSIGMSISLFEEASENITIRAVVEDRDGNLYQPDNITVLRTDGRNVLTRIMFENDRLPARQQYTVSVQTLSNGTWSYPITSTISLDSLTPAIVDIEPDPASPSTAFSVVWVAGSNDTDSFIVTLDSVDGTETRNTTIDVLDNSIDALQNLTFIDLTPGQKYVVKVTAIMGNKTASTLNMTVQMYPATPSDVRVKTSTENTDELEFTWQSEGIVQQFVLEGVSKNNPAVSFMVPVVGLDAVNDTYNYTVPSLVRGEVYNVRVKAVNGDYSSATQFTTIAMYPGKPYDLQLMRYDPSPLDSLVFSWRPRGGRVDSFLIRVMLSRGRGLVKEYKENPQRSEPYGLVLGPLTQGERYEVQVWAVVGNLSSPVAKAASTVGPSVNIRGLTPASIDLELDLFGNMYEDMNVEVNISDASGNVYTPVSQENLTEYSEQGRQIIRLNFMDQLPANTDYTATTELFSRGISMFSLQSEPVLLDGRTPHIGSLMRNELAPNTSLSVSWLPGSDMVDRYKVKWSMINSPDMTEIDVKPSPGLMNANITGLAPGELYRVTVEAESADGTMASSLPEYQRLLPSLPVDVIVMRSELEPRFTIQWARGDGSVTCYNTTIWPQPDPRAVVAPECLPAPVGKGERREVSYNRLLPGETYWSGINSVQDNLESEKVWASVTMYPPGLRITGLKEDPSQGLIVTWVPIEEGKVDSVQLAWTDLDGAHNGSLLLRSNEQRGEIQGLLPGMPYIIGVNSQVLDARENIVQTKGETQVFVTEPAPPEAATFESTKDGVTVNVKQGEGSADSYLFQWQSDQQRSGEARLSVDQAQKLNSTIPLSPGARYIFTVQSIAGGKESQAMTETVITAPEPPRNLALSLGEEPSSVVNLRWDPPISYLQAYHITWDPPASDNTSELHVNSSRSTSASVNNLMPGRTYNFSVYSVAWDSPSEPITSNIHLAPSVPSIIYAEPAANTSVELAWSFGEGSADAAHIYINDGFTTKEIEVPNMEASVDSQQVHYYRVERLKEGLLYGVSMATGSMGILGAPTPVTFVTIPLEGETPAVDVETNSRSATLTWNFPESSLPPDPVPIPDKYRIRVIAPDVENNTACIKEVLVGFCRECEPQSHMMPTDKSPMLSNGASPCAEMSREYIPVDSQVVYNVTGLNPYSTYKLLWYHEGGSMRSGMAITANTSIEAPGYVLPPVVTLIDDVTMNVCVHAPEPYPGPTEYVLHIHDDKQGSLGHSLLNLTLSDADLIDDQRTHCVNISGQPFWSYKFSVTATTEMGSLQSNDSFFQTPETSPGPVQNFEVQSIPYNYSAVRLVWDLPTADQMGGNITSFVIRYWRETPSLMNSTENNSTLLNETGMLSESIVRDLSGLSFVDGHLVTDLPIKPDYNYNIQVLPMTSTGLVGNSSRNVTFSSEIGPPPALSENYPPVITQVTDQGGLDQITVSINPQFFMDNSHGEIIEYGLIVQDSPEGKGAPDTGLEMQYYKNFPDWNEARQTQRGAYRATPTDWTLGVNTNKYYNPSSSQVLYTIGSDGRCTGQNVEFCNGQLDPSKQYSIKGFACTAAGCSETKFYNGFMVESGRGVCVQTADGSHNPYSDLEMALIVVVVILILILIILIVLVLILHLRKQKQKEGRLLKGELNDGHDTMVRGQHMGLTKI